jgi:hypothetical protein
VTARRDAVRGGAVLRIATWNFTDDHERALEYRRERYDQRTHHWVFRAVG